MKKIIKKTKIEKIEKIKDMPVAEPMAYKQECKKEVIAETSIDFNGEALVGLANKVNEIIRYLNK